MKKTVLVIGYFTIIFLVFFVIHLFSSFLPRFEAYHSEKGGFSVSIPGRPRETTDDSGIPFSSQFNVVKVCSETKDWTFMVLCFEPNEAYYPPPWFRKLQKPSLETMQIVAEVITHGRMVNETDVDFHGYPAKDFELKILGRRTVRARAIAIDKKFYQLIVVGNSKKVLGKIPEFFASFQIEGVE